MLDCFALSDSQCALRFWRTAFVFWLRNLLWLLHAFHKALQHRQPLYRVSIALSTLLTLLSLLAHCWHTGHRKAQEVSAVPEKCNTHLNKERKFKHSIWHRLYGWCLNFWLEKSAVGGNEVIILSVKRQACSSFRFSARQKFILPIPSLLHIFLLDSDSDDPDLIGFYSFRSNASLRPWSLDLLVCFLRL